MHFFKRIIFLLGFVILFPITALAANYSLVSGAACGSGSTCPVCSGGGSWSVSGANFTCSTSISLGNGDTITASTAGSITAASTISLNNNTIGSSAANINLISNSNTINTTGNSTIFGSITATSAALNISGGSVSGSVTSGCCSITTNGTVIGGSVTANSGTISITGGSVGGSVTTSCCTITVSNSVLRGSLSANGTITLTNTTAGSFGAPINITAQNAITLNSSSNVYGTLTAPSWSTVNVNSNSSVTGTCIPGSTPANACTVSPLVCTTGLINGLTGKYFNNRTLTGSPAATRIDYTVNFDWANGSPGVTGVSTDSFSVRWDGNLRAPATGNYTFQTVSDDGVRLWINNQLVIDNWTDHASTSNNSASISLVAGQSYPVRLEFYENGGQAVIKLNWLVPGTGTYVAIPTTQNVNSNTSSFCTVPVQSCTSGLMGGAVGKYYNNTNLTGSPVTRNDLAIDFDWSTGTAGVAGVGADNFSVRWDAVMKVPTTGNYQFETISDDGVRLWVNNVLVIDNWTDHSQTSDTTGNISLTAGVSYPVRMEFYENGGYAVAALHWKLPGASAFTIINGCPSTLNNYGISHSGTGITCAAEPITISAYDSAGALVAPSAGTQITLSTSPATGVWSGGSTYLFTGSETSIVKYLQQTSASTLNINVTDGSKSESASLDPSITFNDSGIKFYENTASPTYGINKQVAGVADNNLQIKVLRTDNNTGACVARATGSQTVKLAAVCRNPTTCVAGQSFIVNAPPSIALNANANAATPTFTNVTLNFDGTGTAPLPINYSDVGKIQLIAQMSLAAAGNDPAVTFTQNSNDFVVKPYTLQISSVQTTTGIANPGGTSASGSAAGFVSAGTPFQVKIQAVNGASTPAPTPNFGNEIPVNLLTEKDNLNVKINSLVYPGSGSSTPITGAGDSSFSATTPAGTFVNNSVVWNQVGSLTLVAFLSDLDYLGAGDVSVPPAASAIVGRFYPDHFRLVSSQVTDSCALGGSTFSYMSEPRITLQYKLQAETLGGNIANNYGGNYALGAIATPNYVAENLNSANGGTLSVRVNAGAAAPVWSGGVLDFSSTAASFSREITKGIPDGPYISLQLGMNLVDSFDVRSLQNLDMNSTTAAGSCSPTCTEKSLGAPLNLVYGRLKIDDAFGPETVSLPVNFVTEYWTGNNFSRNGLDSCTIIPRASIIYPAGNLTNDANRTVPVGGGSTQGIYSNLSASGVQFGAGTAGHYFTAPGAGNTVTSFLLQIDLTNFAWLRYDWNQDGNYSDIKLPDPDTTKVPNAKIGFGSYRGNDRIIYWREKLQ